MMPPALIDAMGEVDGHATLFGQVCSECDAVYFPAGDLCPRCGSDAVRRVPLARTGVLRSWTIVRRAPAGMRAPYAVAWVDLADGPRLFSQVDADLMSLRAGMPMEIRFGTPPSGSPSDAYYFVPAHG